MNNATIFTTIETALNKMSQGTNATAYIARTIESQKHDVVLNRIALAYTALVNKRNDAKRAGNTTGGVVAKPEQMISFMQQLMNQLCWAGRRAVIAQETHNSEEQAAGMDFSEAVVEEAGFEANVEDIAVEIEEAWQLLSNVYSWLSAKMNYLQEIDVLAVYADIQNEDESWVTKATAYSFEDARGIMEQVLADINERQAGETADEAANLNFAA